MKKKKSNFRKSHRKKIIKPFYKKRSFLLFLGISFTLILLIYLFLFFSYFWIKNIRIEGNKDLPEEVLFNQIVNRSSRKILFFNSSAIFLFNSGQISEDFLNDFPLIESIQIKKDLPDKIIVIIKERKPSLFWCNDNCFLLDSTGVAFREKEDNDRRRVIVRGGGEFNLGDQIISVSDMQKIISIWKEIGKELEIIEFEIDSQKLNVKTSENWHIYFNTEEDLSTQILKLKLVLEEKISLSNRKNLEYIDLRFDSRVYFK